MQRGSQRVAAFLAVALLTAGCGARWTDEQRAGVEARSRSGGAGTAGPPAVAGQASTAGGAASGVAATGGGDAATAGSGAATSPSGGAPVTGESSTPAGAGGSLPCAAPSDAPGVTDDQISIGSISTLSGIVPGLGASAAAAVRAYVAHRNVIGGVCGRQLVLVDSDDGGDSARYRTVLAEIEPQVVGFAGGLSIGDDGSADIIRDRAIPMIASRSAEGVQGQPTVFDLNPPFADVNAPVGKYDFLHARGVAEAALVYLAVDASRAEANIQRAQMEASGIHIALVQELPSTTLSFDSAARAVANSGAQYLFFIGAESSNVSMARAMFDTGYELQFAEYFQFAYGGNFAEAAGAAAEGATTWTRTLPNEEAATNAEVAAFVQFMDQVDPGIPKDPLAAESWVGAKLLVETLEALPGPITRQALVDQLRATGTYDAGGMLGPIQLGAQRNDGCAIGLQLRSGVWQRLAPATGFLCRP